MAAGLYLLWAVLLFSPQNRDLSSFKFLYVANPVVAALGLFLLSRRWLAGWTPSALAGLLYGFGPFALSFLGFHPVAGLTFAATPCLLLPAVYWGRGQQPTLFRFALRAALCVLPFAFIIGFFWMFSRHWAGPIFLLPGKTLLTGYDFLGLALPLSMTGRPVVISLYHIGILAALMGAFVYLTAQRVTVLIPPVIGLVLAFLDPVCRVSPVIWAALPMVFLAILAGLGFQTLLWAGKSDAKWVLACSLAGLALAGVSLALYLSHKTSVYQYPSLFYTAAAAGLGIIFLLLHIGWRWLPLRWLILVSIVAADSFFTARWLIDKLS
jgi:hypothetical protein